MKFKAAPRFRQQMYLLKDFHNYYTYYNYFNKKEVELFEEELLHV